MFLSSKFNLSVKFSIFGIKLMNKYFSRCSWRIFNKLIDLKCKGNICIYLYFSAFICIFNHSVNHQAFEGAIILVAYIPRCLAKWRQIWDKRVHRISCRDDKCNGLNLSRFKQMSLVKSRNKTSITWWIVRSRNLQ